MLGPTTRVSRHLTPLDAGQQQRHKLRNLVQSVILLGGMVGLLALCGWVLFGPDGVLGMALGGALALAFSPKISPGLVLRLYRARELVPPELPDVFAVLDRLARRAGLADRPKLYYIPSRMLNAFAVGQREDAVIALTDGMLRSLTLRELAGVLAHEISHIRNNDLWLMGLADLVGRLTRLMTLLGLVLLVLAIPVWLSGAATLPWLVIPLLVFAPQLTTLLQLALSRAREYEADLDAAGLTGDPAGLASALAKLERFQRGIWEQILMPGYRLPEPSLLRSHPPTEQRIARLRELEGRAPAPAPVPDDTAPWHAERMWVARRPRGHVLGFWY
jgi:heat shock protein HtpX